MFDQINANIKSQAFRDSLQKRAAKGRLASSAQRSQAKGKEQSKANKSSTSFRLFGWQLRLS